jgi:hypothetical protein
MNYRSLAFRLGAWYTLLLSATFVLVGVGTFLGLQHHLRANLRDSLGRRWTQVEQILTQAPAGTSDASIAREIDTRIAPEFNNRFVRVTRAPTTLVYRSGPPADRSFDPSAVSVMAVPTALGTAAPLTEIVSDQHMMIRAVPVEADSGKYLVELGVSTGSMDDVLNRLLDLLALLLPVLIVCAAGGGSGLGLSIVKSICTAHGAQIEVQSRPRCGSSFRLRFPRRLIVAATMDFPRSTASDASASGGKAVVRLGIANPETTSGLAQKGRR